jgi:predicted PurR-regulated permease PerM
MEKMKRYQNQFFFILLGLSVILCFFILRPFLITLLIAMAFAVVLNPVYKQVRRLFGRWKGIAAIVTILGMLIILAAPLTLIISRVVTESRQAYASLGSELTQPDSIIRRIEQPIQAYVPSFQIHLDSIVRPFLQSLSDNAATIFATTITTILNTIIFFIGLFFLLKDGSEIKRWLLEISPLPNEYDGVIIYRLEATINSVIHGSLLIALIQGTAAGIGYAIFGLPNPTLFGLLTAFASLIPGIGTAVITLPAALYLYLTGNPISGLGLAIWGLTLVGTIDNVFRPFIISMRKGVNVHPFLVFISVLGGLAFFGPWGFLLGPVTISFLLALLDVFGEFLSGTADEPGQSLLPKHKSRLLAMTNRLKRKIPNHK